MQMKTPMITRVTRAAWFCAVLAAAASAAVVTATGAAGQSQGAPSAAERGRQLYTAYGCWQCHGQEGQGGGYVGPKLAPKPIGYEFFERYVRSPRGDMPPYTTKVVSDESMRDIHAFLQSVPPSAPVDRLSPLTMAPVSAGQAAEREACAAMATRPFSGGRITGAHLVSEGSFTPPVGPQGGGSGGASPYAHLPRFCRIEAALTPTSDSEIGIEVWLPVDGWNGKLESVGNGGWAGNISYPAMAGALALGYATASTDTGHTGGGSQFVVGHPEKFIDFGWRAVHEMTLAAKVVIKGYYNSPAKFAYWNGCSTGGRQGVNEAQRFPADYDGIIAGAPAINWVRGHTMQLWIANATLKDPTAHVPASKFPVINKAVLDACDALDGVRDGVLENPMACRFDPASIQCKAEERPDCLTAAQVETVRRIYGPSKSPTTGAFIANGLAPGSELMWGALAGGPAPFGIPVDYFRNVVFRDPSWDYRTMDFDRDVAAAEKADANVTNLYDTNLRPFFSRGGKLLLYHGWSDQLIPPMNSVDFYTAVTKTLGGPSQVADSMRLFMVPGMQHCNGGPGTSTFDALSALEAWVERKQAPAQLPASHAANGTVDRTRPLCPYPQVAVYSGSGSTDDAANFVCRVK